MTNLNIFHGLYLTDFRTVLFIKIEKLTENRHQKGATRISKDFHKKKSLKISFESGKIVSKIRNKLSVHVSAFITNGTKKKLPIFFGAKNSTSY